MFLDQVGINPMAELHAIPISGKSSRNLRMTKGRVAVGKIESWMNIFPACIAECIGKPRMETGIGYTDFTIAHI